ncbi:MAG TPA: DctP family TRAP transporter solute-binding subunit [Stellaceae bacterium]|nr:DctP family TRAP transporter solute-binding subunit [Stellaceae bacterium]
MPLRRFSGLPRSWSEIAGVDYDPPVDYDLRMSTDPTPRFRYRLGLNQPAASPTVRRITEMAEKIRQETAEELLVEVFPESRLGPDPKMFADLRSGALEFFMAGATLGEVAPTSALPLLPFAFRDSKAVFAALDGALGDQIRSELAQHGIHAFRHCLQNGFHHLTTSTRPIHSAADLAGVKIRSPGGAIARDFFEAFGAEAGYVPFSQMYDALKGRSFDGQSDPLGVVLSLRLYEVQTYLSLTAHWWSGFTLMANAAAWSALPRAIQEIVERNAEKCALLQREDIEQVNAAGAEELARRGMQVNTADTAGFREKLGAFYARWREKAGPATWRVLESYAGEIGR